MEILLVHGSEINISRTAKFLKERHVKKILPRNIFIHSTAEKSASEMALVIRDVVKNKILHEYRSLADRMCVFFSKSDAKERHILVTNLNEIEKILKFAKDKHEISFDDSEIEKGSIISIPVNNGSKVAKKIFPLSNAC